MQRAIDLLPLAPLAKRLGRSCSLVPAPLAVFEKILYLLAQ